MHVLRSLLIAFGLVACTTQTPLEPTLGTPNIPLAAYTSIPTGKLVGLSDWPLEFFGTPPMTVTTVTGFTREVDDILREARANNMPVVFGFRRADVSDDGTPRGSFSLTKAKAAVDRFADGPLSPAVVAEFAPWIKAWYLIDEPFCADCWGGRAASSAAILEYAKYFRAKIDPLRRVPMAIRVPPSKLDDHGDWSGVIDVAWVVYKTGNKLTVTQLLDQEAAIATKFGWRIIAGINAENCDGGQTRSDTPCSADVVKRNGEAILRHPAVCLLSSWRYSQEIWSRSDIRAAWAYLSNVGQSLPSTSCAATAGGGTPPPPSSTIARVELKPDGPVRCGPGDVLRMTATAYDAAGTALNLRLAFRSNDDTRVSVTRIDNTTLRATCRRVGDAWVVAAKDGIRDRTFVNVR